MVLDPLDEEDEPAEFQAGEDIGPSPPEPPSVDVPSVETPEASSGPGIATGDVPDDVAKSFWKAVVTLNLAVFAASLGPMLVYFRGQFVEGGLVFLLGLLAFAQTYRIYRNYHRDRASEESASDVPE